MSRLSGLAREVLEAAAPMIADAAGADAPTFDLTDALREFGVWRMLQPKRYGARTLGVDDFISVLSQLAGLDGSVGWLIAAFNTAAYDVAGLPGALADEVWGADGSALVVACHRREGQLVRTHDGLRLTGRWHRVVGCELADWLLLTAADDNGAHCRVLVPRRDVGIEANAPRNGLPAAGIGDVVISALPASPSRIVPTTRDRGGPARSGQLQTPVVVGAGAAAAVVGSADGVWRTHVDEIRKRISVSFARENLTDRGSSTVEVARAASDLDVARLQVQTSTSIPDGVDRLVAAVWAQRQAVVRARDVADRLLGSSRRHALDASAPVIRGWHDVHAGWRLALDLYEDLAKGPIRRM